MCMIFKSLRCKLKSFLWYFTYFLVFEGSSPPAAVHSRLDMEALTVSDPYHRVDKSGVKFARVGVRLVCRKCQRPRQYVAKTR